MKPTPAAMRIHTHLRLLRRRFSRRHRLKLAYRELELRQLPPNRWDMTEAEHAEFMRQADQFRRDFRRINRVAARWGYQPA